MSRARVLVVEDDPSVRSLLQTLLTSEGYDVAVASDGLGGLACAAAARPSLVLLDVMMPDLGGQRVLQEMRRDTGQVDAVPELRGEVGDDNVFVKPFAVSELLARVGELTGGPASR